MSEQCFHFLIVLSILRKVKKDLSNDNRIIKDQNKVLISWIFIEHPKNPCTGTPKIRKRGIGQNNAFSCLHKNMNDPLSSTRITNLYLSYKVATISLGALSKKKCSCLSHLGVFTNYVTQLGVGGWSAKALLLQSLVWYVWH